MYLNPLSRNNPGPSQRSPELWIPLSLKLTVYLWLTYFLYQAATTFYEYQPGQSWPFMLSIFRTFTFLPIHEAGHFLFMFFGRTLHILGGSFWQIMFVALWFVIGLRQRSHVAPFPLFWVGENMMDSAETFADIFYYCGILLRAGAIGSGVFLAFRSFLRLQVAILPSLPDTSSSFTTIDDSLDEMLERKNKTSGLR